MGKGWGWGLLGKWQGKDKGRENGKEGKGKEKEKKEAARRPPLES
jgi:hypothetical protein